jgi:hypothetical protein
MVSLMRSVATLGGEDFARFVDKHGGDLFFGHATFSQALVGEDALLIKPAAGARVGVGGYRRASVPLGLSDCAKYSIDAWDYARFVVGALENHLHLTFGVATPLVSKILRHLSGDDEHVLVHERPAERGAIYDTGCGVHHHGVHIGIPVCGVDLLNDSLGLELRVHQLTYSPPVRSADG